MSKTTTPALTVPATIDATALATATGGTHPGEPGWPEEPKPELGWRIGDVFKRKLPPIGRRWE